MSRMLLYMIVWNPTGLHFDITQVRDDDVPIIEAFNLKLAKLPIMFRPPLLTSIDAVHVQLPART